MESLEIQLKFENCSSTDKEEKNTRKIIRIVKLELWNIKPFSFSANPAGIFTRISHLRERCFSMFSKHALYCNQLCTTYSNISGVYGM